MTYQNVTPTVFECMKKKLEAAGTKVPHGNSGEMSSKGVTAHFEWDGKERLKITINKKPFYATCSMIIGKITNFVHECDGS